MIKLLVAALLMLAIFGIILYLSDDVSRLEEQRGQLLDDLSRADSQLRLAQRASEVCRSDVLRLQSELDTAISAMSKLRAEAEVARHNDRL